MTSIWKLLYLLEPSLAIMVGELFLAGRSTERTVDKIFVLRSVDSGVKSLTQHRFVYS